MTMSISNRKSSLWIPHDYVVHMTKYSARGPKGSCQQASSFAHTHASMLQPDLFTQDFLRPCLLPLSNIAGQGTGSVCIAGSRISYDLWRLHQPRTGRLNKLI